MLEDQPVVRRLLTDVVRTVHPDARIIDVASCADAQAAMDEHDLDLALVDLGLPDGSGIDVIRRLKQQHPDAEVVVATIFDDDSHLFEAMEAGADGYLLKESSRDELVDGLRDLRHGRPPLSDPIARRLVSFFHQPAPADQPRLTPREREVLKLLAKGLNRADIAELLGLTKNTVSDYIKAIYKKLDVSSRAEAALEAERLGLVSRSR